MDAFKNSLFAVNILIILYYAFDQLYNEIYV